MATPVSAQAPVVASAGIQIAIYPGTPSVAWIDERRWVEVDDKTLTLPRGSVQSSLAEMTIEALAGSALRIGTCTSNAVFALESERSQVTCAVEGPTGKHLVRARYKMSHTLAVEHDVVFRAPRTATVVSRLVLTPPARQDDVREAEVVVYDRAPDGGSTPRALARVTVTLDGAEIAIVPPPRRLPARLRRVLDASGDMMTGRLPVELELTLPAGELVAGRANVTLADTGERRTSLTAPSERDGVLRLGIEQDMYGIKTPMFGARPSAVDRFQFELVNDSDTAREVWIVEHVGNASYRVSGGLHVERTSGDVRFKLPVPANGRASALVSIAPRP